MKLVYFLLFIVLILIILLFTVALRVKLVFDSNKKDLNMTLLWLYPLFKALVTVEAQGPMLVFYLFNTKVYEKLLKPKKPKKSKLNQMELMRIINPKDIHVDANYGFHDPFITGVACGAMNIASQVINIDSMRQTPDFTSTDDYIQMDATAKVNLGSALIKLFKQNNNSRKQKI